MNSLTVTATVLSGTTQNSPLEWAVGIAMIGFIVTMCIVILHDTFRGW